MDANEILSVIADACMKTGQGFMDSKLPDHSRPQIAMALAEVAARIRKAVPEPVTEKAAAGPASSRVVHRLADDEDPLNPFLACCGYNYRAVLQSGDLVSGNPADVTCPGRQAADPQPPEPASAYVQAVDATEPRSFDPGPTPQSVAAFWQRVAVALIRCHGGDVTITPLQFIEADLPLVNWQHATAGMRFWLTEVPHPDAS